MRKDGRALMESILLHSLPAGFLILLAGSMVPPPKPIHLDFSILKCVDTPPQQNISTQKEEAPAVSQSEPVTKPQPKVTAHISPQKVKRINPKAVTAEPKAMPAKHPDYLPTSPEVSSPRQDFAQNSPTRLKQAVLTSRQDMASEQNVSRVRNYLGLVRIRIEQQKRYPLRARSRRLEGKVSIRFVLSPDGQVSAVDVSKSSGHNCLDEAAVDAVRQASPMPPPPDGVLSRATSMELTIVFKLT